jgi:cobalt-precorrin-6B (C15)-methyltransferase
MKFIKDEEFIRGNCPMTKEEIRILTVAKLELEDDFNILDVGAGTGSVSIQIAKCCPKGQVTAIEMDSEALETIKINKEKFKAGNLQIVEGEALKVLDNIKGEFDGIFIGGSGGNIETIISEYGKKLKIGRKMLLNFITINNLYKAMNTLKELNYLVECIEVGVSKTVGNSYMLKAQNPIFIITATKVKEAKNNSWRKENE